MASPDAGVWLPVLTGPFGVEVFAEGGGSQRFELHPPGTHWLLEIIRAEGGWEAGWLRRVAPTRLSRTRWRSLPRSARALARVALGVGPPS